MDARDSAGVGPGAVTGRPTVVVVSLGDDPRLPACLEALARNGPSGCELVVVENGAPGPPPELPLAATSRLRRTGNPGFAAAVDEALEASSGDPVLVLNPDCLLEPGGYGAAVRLLASDPGVGAVAFRLLRPGGKILDSAGVRLGWLRRARDRGMGRSAAGRFTTREEVDAPCLAAALLRRCALLAARDGRGEVLDRRYVAYKEDVDLGWRLRRAGWRVVYEPGALAVHERGWPEGARRRIPLRLRRMSLRNRLWTIAKNESLPGLLLRLPFYFCLESLTCLYLLAREPAVLAAYPRALRGLRECLARRPLAPDGAPKG